MAPGHLWVVCGTIVFHGNRYGISLERRLSIVLLPSATNAFTTYVAYHVGPEIGGGWTFNR